MTLIDLLGEIVDDARIPAADEETRCWVRDLINHPYPNRNPWIDRLDAAVGSVSSSGELDALGDRLRLAHPNDRPHISQFDLRTQDVLNEACAFATASASDREHSAHFTVAEGEPDIRAGSLWLEAKNVHPSDVDRAETAQMLSARVTTGTVDIEHTGLYKKLLADINDASQKFHHVEAIERVLLINFVGVDTRSVPDWPSILATLRRWSKELKSTASIQLVVTEQYDWLNPVLDRRIEQWGEG